jgi:hypothetical protein
MAQCKHSHSKRRNRRMVRENGAKVRQKLSRADIKSYELSVIYIKI